MTATETISARGTVNLLWGRAPLWRFSFMSAGLLTLLFILFPPAQQADNNLGSALPAQATYASRFSLPNEAAPPSPPSPQKSAPQTADLSMARPGNAESEPIRQETGIDPAMLGRLYSGSIMADGFNIPLPEEHWAMLSAAKLNSPKSSGVIYFLARIAQKKLVGGLIVTVARTKPTATDGGDRLNWKKQSTIFRSDECAAGDGTQIQSCWMIYDFFTAWWHKWGDRTAKMSNIERAAAGSMDAKGISYPQDMVAIRLIRNDKWGLVTAVYLFNPETEHIASSEALSFVDSDWAAANIQRFPEKLAYVEKLKQAGNSLWPKFKAAFIAAK